MADIPVSLDEMENIVESVSRELLEQWAIDDRFTEEEIEKATQDAVDDTVFVIQRYMDQFNNLMITKAHQSKII